MFNRGYTKEQVGELGREIYARKLKSILEPDFIGQRLIIDILSEDYEVDSDVFAMSDRAHAKHPDGVFYGMRVGFKSCGTIGCSMSSQAS